MNIFCEITKLGNKIKKLLSKSIFYASLEIATIFLEVAGKSENIQCSYSNLMYISTKKRAVSGWFCKIMNQACKLIILSKIINSNFPKEVFHQYKEGFLN